MDPDVSVQEIDRFLEEVDSIALESPRRELWDCVIQRIESTWQKRTTCSIWGSFSPRTWTCLKATGQYHDESRFLADGPPDQRDYWTSNDHRVFAFVIQTQAAAASCFVVRFSTPVPATHLESTAKILLAFVEVLRTRELANLERFVGNDLPAFFQVLRTAWELQDKAEAAYHIVNQFALSLPSDRVFLTQYNGHERPQILAVSGISNPEPGVAELERGIQLGQQALSTQQLQNASNSHDAQIEAPRSRSIGKLNYAVAIPLDSGTGESRHALVMEWVDSDGYLESYYRLQLLSPVVGVEWTALDRWLSVPFWIRERAIKKTGSISSNHSTRKRRAMWGLLAVVVSCLILCIPCPLKIDVYGSLQPEQRRAVFAPADCVVAKLYVQDGQAVTAGQALLSLQSPFLDIEVEEVRGEIRANQEKRDILEISINQLEEPETGSVLASQLASEVKQLETLYQSLRNKLAALQTEQKKLEVLAPISGVVMAEDLETTLDARPLRQGDLLLNVVDMSGQWRLELEVTDRDVDFVRRWFARTEHDGENATPNHARKFEFVFDSQPDLSLVASAVKLGRATRRKNGGVPSLDLQASLAFEDARKGYIGARVHGRIECESQPIWFVWTRPFLESIQRRMWF